MLTLLIYFLVAIIILALAWYIVSTLLPLPEPLGRIVQIVFVVIGIVIVIYFLLAIVGQAPTLALR